MENYTVKEGKTMAIISYLTIIGTIVAFVMNNNKRNYFASFHIRQMVGIFLLSMVNKYLIYDYLGSTIGWITGIFVFILWVIGILGAIQGEEKLVPVLGEHFQNWFKGIQ